MKKLEQASEKWIVLDLYKVRLTLSMPMTTPSRFSLSSWHCQWRLTSYLVVLSLQKRTIVLPEYILLSIISRMYSIDSSSKTITESRFSSTRGNFQRLVWFGCFGAATCRLLAQSSSGWRARWPLLLNFPRLNTCTHFVCSQQNKLTDSVYAPHQRSEPVKKSFKNR